MGNLIENNAVAILDGVSGQNEALGYELHSGRENGKSQNFDPEDKQEKQFLKANEPIIFLNSVTTVNDGTTLWTNRMDHYYIIGSHNVHMADILDCMILVTVLGIFLCGLVECR